MPSKPSSNTWNRPAGPAPTITTSATVTALGAISASGLKRHTSAHRKGRQCNKYTACDGTARPCPVQHRTLVSGTTCYDEQGDPTRGQESRQEARQEVRQGLPDRHPDAAPVSARS